MAIPSIRISLLTASIMVALPAFAGDSALAVDRGLPQANLNNDSGPVRSNVRWGWHEHGFLGDDFTIGAPGEQWVIDSIRTWAVPGTAQANLPHFGDYFQDVRLHFGQCRTGQKRQEPDDVLGSIGRLHKRERLAAGVGNHSGKSQVGRAVRQVRKRAALHVHKRSFTCGVHDFQDKRAAIRSGKMKIVVVFAGQSPQFPAE